MSLSNFLVSKSKVMEFIEEVENELKNLDQPDL